MPGGFSLMEVVIAVGIFGATMTVLLGLLPFLVRQAGTTADSLAAVRLPDAVRLELQRVVSLGGLDALAGPSRPLAAPAPATLALLSDRKASRVQTADYLPPAGADRIPAAEQYFLIEVWRFPAGPLAYVAGGNLLALHVRVSWPYQLPGATMPTAPRDREQISFNLALCR
jgi:hypothetical protein